MSFGGRGGGRGRGRGGRPVESGGLLLLRRSAEECGLDSRNIRSLGDIAARSPLYPDIELQYSSSPAGETPSSIISTAAAKRHSAQTIYLIAKSREIHHRITNSVFFVRPTKDVPDVLRYSDLTRSHNKKRQRLLAATVDSTPKLNNEANIVLAHCLGGRQETVMGRFVPEELVTLGQQKALSRRALINASAALNASSSAGDFLIDDTAAWEESFGPDDDDDEGVLTKPETARQRSDSTGSAINNTEKTAAEDELDEVSAEEEEEELEDYVTNYYDSGPEEGDDDGDDEPTF